MTDALLLAAVLAVLALTLALAVWATRRRRRDAGPAEVADDDGTIAPSRPAPIPSAAQSKGEAPSAANLDITIDPEDIFLGPSGARFIFHFSISNRTRKPLVALRLWTDLIAAHGSLESQSQLLGPDMEEAQLHRIPLLDPGQLQTWRATLSLAGESMRPLVHESDTLLLPLVRLRVVGAGIPPVRRNFVIGLPGADPHGRLRALPMTGQPQRISGLAARDLD